MVHLFWDTAEPQLPSELKMSLVAVLYPVLGKARQALHDTVGSALFGESCIIYDSGSLIVYHL